MPNAILYSAKLTLFILLAVQGASQVADSSFAQINIFSLNAQGEIMYSELNDDFLLEFFPAYPKFSPFLNFQAGNDGNKILPSSISKRLAALPDPFSLPKLYFLNDDQAPALVACDKPFTFINFYQAAPEDESFQKIQIIHAQRLSEKVRFGLSAYNHSAKGSLQNEQNKTYQVNLWSEYKSNNYSALLQADLHSVKSMENGGLSNDSLFISGNFSNPKFDLPINLSKAKSAYSTKSISLFNYWNLNKDSSQYNLAFRINSSVELKQRTYSDEGVNLPFYQSLGLDSVYTFDSLSVFSIKTQPGLIVENRSNRWVPSMSLGITHIFSNVFYSESFLDQNLILNLAADLIDNPEFEIGSNIDIHLIGYYAGDLKTQLFLTQKSDSSALSHWKFRASFNKSRLPLGACRLFESDFNNSLKPQESLVFSAHYNGIKSGLQFFSFAGLTNNYIYFNESVQLVNYTKAVAFVESGIHYKIALEHFDWKSNFSLQWLSDQEMISYPWWLLSSSVEYKSQAFSKKMDFAIGAGLWLNEGSFLPAYNPVYGAFYEQKVQLSNLTPWIDVYLKFRIKTAGFFVRFENLLSIAGYKYQYLIADFPAQMPRLGFGVNWYMFD